MATDVGVDPEAETITIGLLSDLSGPFAPLVQVIVAGQEMYWADVNANGGIGGMQVQIETRDTAYDPAQHVQLYEELKTQVVAFGHSTGSPQTMAINPQLQADGILAIPLTWYSGWSDPAINSNLVPHGVPYCIEAMNMIEYLTLQAPDATTIAIASSPGDYGEDSNAGARLAAEALGLEIVYDGTGLINQADEATLTEVAGGIASSGAELVWVTTSPTPFRVDLRSGPCCRILRSPVVRRRPDVEPGPGGTGFCDLRASVERLLHLGVLRTVGRRVRRQSGSARPGDRSRCGSARLLRRGRDRSHDPAPGVADRL